MISAETEGPLSVANGVFKDAYQAARTNAELRAPLFIVLVDELALHVRGERRSFGFRDAQFHRAKAVAHVAVALYAMTASEPPLPAETVLRLAAMVAHCRKTLATLGAEMREDAALERELEAIVESALAFAEQALTEPQGSRDARAEFARVNGERILRATELATRRQIAALHRAVENAIATLSAVDRTALQVVVVGDHQARSRSMGMQYFQRRLGEREGEDERVTYGENVANEQQALALVGTRNLDRDIASAFFDDEKRLQRDVLADAAKACLDQLDPPLIV